jgi:predicted ester cyclase
MSIEENKAIVLLNMKDVLEQGRVELIDQCFAPQGSASHWGTPEQWKNAVLFWHKTCPGFKVNILALTAEDDRVIATIRFDLTYSVPMEPLPFAFPPLGKPVSWQNLNYFQIANGKIVSTFEFGGWTRMLLENGVIPVKKIDQNKAAVHKFLEGVNTRDAALLAEVCTPDVARSWTNSLPGAYARFKDHHIELTEIVSDSERVAVRVETSGYFTGEWHGIQPTGKFWTNHGNGIFFFTDGKISKTDFVFDVENHLKQLGGVIGPAAPATSP